MRKQKESAHGRHSSPNVAPGDNEVKKTNEVPKPAQDNVNDGRKEAVVEFSREREHCRVYIRQ